MTDFGVCCAFNQQLKFKENYYTLVQEMQVIAISSNFNILILLTQAKAGSGRKESNLGLTESGVERGLRLILDRNFDRWRLLSCAICTIRCPQSLCFYRVGEFTVLSSFPGFSIFFGQTAEFPLLQVKVQHHT